MKQFLTRTTRKIRKYLALTALLAACGGDPAAGKNYDAGLNDTILSDGSTSDSSTDAEITSRCSGVAGEYELRNEQILNTCTDGALEKTVMQYFYVFPSTPDENRFLMTWIKHPGNEPYEIGVWNNMRVMSDNKFYNELGEGNKIEGQFFEGHGSYRINELIMVQTKTGFVDNASEGLKPCNMKWEILGLKSVNYSCTLDDLPEVDK